MSDVRQTRRPDVDILLILKFLVSAQGSDSSELRRLRSDLLIPKGDVRLHAAFPSHFFVYGV